MTEIVFKALGYIAVIAISYAMKRKIGENGGVKKLFTRVLLWITLPSAVACSFSSDINIASYLWLVAAGFILNVFMAAVGVLFSGKDAQNRSLNMINMSGYNIGAFAMPFVSGFLGAGATSYVCLFDAGSAIMCTGGIYAAANLLNGKKTGIKGFLKSLFSSVPFDAYLFMLIFTLAGGRLPEFAKSFFTVAANANGFIAMFLVGQLLDFKPKKEFVKSACLILAVRYGFSALFSAAIMLFLPVERIIKEALVMSLFAPITAIAPVFTEKCGSKSDVSNFAGSCSFIISLAILVALALAFNA